jgi:transcriptional regulator with XRE-family HTH domain
MLGEALRLIRVFHDLKQSEMALKLGISKSYLSEIESGEKTPTIPLIRKYSNELDLPVSSIMFFAENFDRDASYEKARAFVAPKIIRLLKFLEVQSSNPHVD